MTPNRSPDMNLPSRAVPRVASAEVVAAWAATKIMVAERCMKVEVVVAEVVAAVVVAAEIDKRA